MDDKTVSDESLVALCLAGETQVFKILFERYQNPLYNFVYPFVKDVDQAADIVQDTFIKVWQQLNKFDLDKKFRSWIFTIAKNTAITTLRYVDEKCFIPFSSFEDEYGKSFIAETTADGSPRPDEMCEQHELHQLLNALIAGVKPHYRGVLELHYGHGYHFEEIAETLHIPLATTLTRHHRGIQAMKKIVQERR